MRIIQTEIRDIWQYLNNQLRNRGNGGGQNWSGCWSSWRDARGDQLLNSWLYFRAKFQNLREQVML
jgi:chitinase